MTSVLSIKLYFRRIPLKYNTLQSYSKTTFIRHFYSLDFVDDIDFDKIQLKTLQMYFW